MTTAPDLEEHADRSAGTGPPAQPGGTNADGPGQRSEAASRVLFVLEDNWHAIRARHPQIPPVVIIIASGTSGRDAKWGHFSPRRWTVDTTGTVAEILISGEGLHRSPRAAVLGTLLHEAAHALAAARGIQGDQPPAPLPQSSIQGPGRRTRPGRRPRRADRVVADQRPRPDCRNLRPVASQAPRRHDLVAARRVQRHHRYRYRQRHPRFHPQGAALTLNRQTSRNAAPPAPSVQQKAVDFMLIRCESTDRIAVEGRRISSDNLSNRQ